MSDIETGAPQGVPQGEPVPTPAPEAPQPGTEQPPEGQQPPEGENKDDKPRKPWFQVRFDQLTKEKYTAQREAEQAKAALAAALRATEQAPQDQTQPPQGQPANPADIERLAEQKARELVRAQQFDAECNAAFDAGVKAFPDFQDALSTLNMVAPLASRPDVVEAALATGEGAKVLYELGKDPDTAAHVLSLPPVRMAVELARLASKPAAVKPVSSAPAPIRPVDGAAKAAPDPEKMTTAEWMEWRRKNRFR